MSILVEEDSKCVHSSARLLPSFGCQHVFSVNALIPESRPVCKAYIDSMKKSSPKTGSHTIGLSIMTKAKNGESESNKET